MLATSPNSSCTTRRCREHSGTSPSCPARTQQEALEPKVSGVYLMRLDTAGGGENHLSPSASVLDHLGVDHPDGLEKTPTTTPLDPSVSAPCPADSQNHTASRSGANTVSRSAQQPDRTACSARQGWDRGGTASSRSKRRDESCGKYAGDGALRNAGSGQTAHRSASAPRAPSICCRNCRLHPEAQRRRAVTWPVQRRLNRSSGDRGGIPVPLL